MRYSTEKIEEIAKALRDMPPIKPQKEHSKQEAVRILAKEITALQKRGYTLEQIAEKLRDEGLDISTPTLKSYLQRAKTKKAKSLRRTANEKSEDTSKVIFLQKSDSLDS